MKKFLPFAIVLLLVSSCSAPELFLASKQYDGKNKYDINYYKSKFENEKNIAGEPILNILDSRLDDVVIFAFYGTYGGDSGVGQFAPGSFDRNIVFGCAAIKKVSGSLSCVFGFNSYHLKKSVINDLNYFSYSDSSGKIRSENFKISDIEPVKKQLSCFDGQCRDYYSYSRKYRFQVDKNFCNLVYDQIKKGEPTEIQLNYTEQSYQFFIPLGMVHLIWLETNEYMKNKYWNGKDQRDFGQETCGTNQI